MSFLTLDDIDTIDAHIRAIWRDGVRLVFGVLPEDRAHAPVADVAIRVSRECASCVFCDREWTYTFDPDQWHNSPAWTADDFVWFWGTRVRVMMLDLYAFLDLPPPDVFDVAVTFAHPLDAWLPRETLADCAALRIAAVLGYDPV